MNSPANIRPTPHRFEALDSLRGVGAILVVMFHMPVASHWRDWSVIQHGYLFVDYFFVLSGFVIAHAYAGRLKNGHDAGRFMIRRIGRIWPLHVLMLAAFIALEFARQAMGFDAITPFARDRSLESIATNLLLIQAWHIHPWLTWNGPAWTLSAEFACYLIFTGLVLIAPRRFRWIGTLIAMMGGIIVLTFAQRWMNTTFDFAVPRAAYGFFLGCLLQGGWTLIPRLKGLPATALEIATLILLCAFVGWAQGPVTVAVTLLFLGVVWVFAGEDGAVSRLLRRPAMVALGRWSFSIYMVHMFVLTVMMIVARPSGLMPGGRRVDFGSVWINDLASLTMLGLILALAILAHRWVEVPAQKRIDRWTVRH